MVRPRDGVPIVLTATSIEMSHFDDDPFYAFAGSFILVPSFLHRYFYPAIRADDDGRAPLAPYGLRKVEAALLEAGFDEEEVAVVHPSQLHRFIGPRTKVVGISSMDPLGLAYVSLTYSSIFAFGAQPRNRLEFCNLLMRGPIHRARLRWGTRVIVGGAGAWQVSSQSIRNHLGIDCTVIGEAEGVAAEIFGLAVKGEPLPPVVDGKSPPSVKDIPLIRGGAIHGCVEVTRGCGRGCQFCSPTQRHRLSIPLPRILSEVEVNLRAGNKMIVLNTEDLFLYGLNSPHFIPNRTKVVEMVHAVTSVPGVEYVQPAHIALAPVCANPQMVEEVAHLLLPKARYKRRGRPYVTAEAGVETGSVRLMKERMAGKALPFKPEEWPDLVEQAFGILNDNRWYPLTTWIMGMPGEQEEDVQATLELLDRLKGYKAFYVPLFFVPLRPSLLSNGRGPKLESLTEAQQEFFTRAWEFNLDIWRRPLRLTSPFSLITILTLPLAGGLLYLTAGRRNPTGPIMKRLLFHSLTKSFFEPS